MSSLYRGPSKDASYLNSIHLAKRLPSSLAKGYDPLYSSSPLALLRRIFEVTR
jgi:hypothetical protein